MAHYEPPHQDLRCLQIQLFSSLVVKELRNIISDLGMARGCIVRQSGRVCSVILILTFHYFEEIPSLLPGIVHVGSNLIARFLYGPIIVYLIIF